MYNSECITFFKIGKGKNPLKPVLVTTTVANVSSFEIPLHLKDCPIGFEFVGLTGKCECSHVLQWMAHQHICAISSNGYYPLITVTLTAQLKSWIGVASIGNKNIFGVSQFCSLYCNLNRRYDTYVIDGSIIRVADLKNLADNDTLCPDNREGVFCSRCALGYTVWYFGSIDCKQCSVWWLLSLIVYGVAGVIFIWFLFIFKLTITTGKLNGIIFYAQVVCIVQVQKVLVSHHDFLSVYYTLARGLISLINLTINFNFPLCFYHGMTELWKSGLSLAFPVYLLAIVIGLIIISRYSVRLSNRIADSSVQVLVTIVHLSFATLLTSTMDVFTPVYVYTNTSDVPLKVWQE